MRIDRRLLNWGIFFVVLGGIPLAVQQGWIPDDIRWWELWPLLLIGLGVGILLRRSAAAAFGGVIIAATFGLMIGGALANGFGGFPTVGFGCVGTSAGTPFPTQDGAFTGDRAVVRLEMGCGDLAVTTEAGSAWSLSGTASHGRLPSIERSASLLTVRDTGQDFSDFFRDRSVWDVTLPTEPTLDLNATVNAGTGRLVLDGARLDGVSLSINAGDGRVDLGSATASNLSVDVNAGSATVILPDGSLTGSLTANAGSIKFCAPPSVSLRLRTNDNITASDNYGDAGLQEVSDNVWESPDWATATKRIELTTTANAASFTLNPKDGCQ
jgi:LiaF transmembrane domain